jgi:hypothetical protein
MTTDDKLDRILTILDDITTTVDSHTAMLRHNGEALAWINTGLASAHTALFNIERRLERFLARLDAKKERS